MIYKNIILYPIISILKFFGHISRRGNVSIERLVEQGKVKVQDREEGHTCDATKSKPVCADRCMYAMRILERMPIGDNGEIS